MNKKKARDESIEIYKTRLDQVNEKLKGQLSIEQRETFESEKRIAAEEILKLETTK